MISGAELLAEFEGGMTYSQIGEQHGMTHGQVAGKIYAERIRRQLNLKTAPRPDLFNVTEMDKPMHFTGDAMIVGDIHVPTTDYALWALVLMVARKQLPKPRRLIIAGDLFNMDIFSKYQAFFPQASWSDEMLAARQLLDEAAEVFDEVDIFMGNHDDRATKFTKQQTLSLDLMKNVTLKMKKPPVISNLCWCTLETPKGMWRITHPSDDYSKVPLTVANKLAWNYDMNIVSLHEHHLAIGTDTPGRHTIINGGGLFDPHNMEYANRVDNTKAAMVQGFVMLRNGVPYLFGDQNFTDYEVWIGKK